MRTDDEVDRLYELAPEEFVTARNALAKALRAEKRREEAAMVAGLRKPSAASWALNQVARHEPALVQEALEAGAALRAASESALAGDASGLRAATAAERATADAVIDAAVARLGRAGARTQVAATLRAAVLDEAVADELRRGVLSTDHDASGFGFGAGANLTLVPPSGAKAPRQPKGSRPAKVAKAAEAAERSAQQAAAREAEERAREERRRRAAREAALTRLAQRADRLARAAERAEEAARDARSAADAAAAELAAARAEDR